MTLTSTIGLSTVKNKFQANGAVLADQLEPDVLGLSNGGFVVACRTDIAGKGKVSLDFYDADHNKIGPAKFATSYSSDAQGQPLLAQLSNGNVVVVWDEETPGDYGLKASIFGPDGTLVKGEFFLEGVGAYTQVSVTARDFGFLVSYTLDGTIICNFYTSDGKLQFPGSVTVSDGKGHASDSQIAQLADGGFVITWTDTFVASKLQGRVFNEDGTPRTGILNLDAFANNTQSSVAALPNGNWAVVHTDSGWSNEGGSTSITLQIFDPNGANVTPGSGFIRVNGTSTKLNESDPDVTVLDNGFIVVTWTRPYANGAPDIKARVFDQNGNPVAVDGYIGEFSISSSFGADVKSAVSALLSGQFVTAWQDSDSDGSGGRISAAVRELVRTTTGDGVNDSFTGDALRDSVSGGGGNDTLKGMGGKDTVGGDGGNDLLYGQAAADTLDGGFGNDVLNGGAGGDQLKGGDGYDTASYSLASAGLTVSLANPAANTGEAKGDSYASIEHLQGSNYKDMLIGDSGANWLNGGLGADTLKGGDGFDTASYASAKAGVTASLANPSANTGEAQGDVYDSIEALAGSNHNDSLTGEGGANWLIGGLGRDTLTGGLGGDTFDFNSVTESAAGASTRDVITDFNAGSAATFVDRIDVSNLDADWTTAGNQAFSFIGSAAFAGNAGELRVTQAGAGVKVLGDQDGDGDADFEISITNPVALANLTAIDFVL